MLNQEITVENLPRKQKGLTTVEYAVAGGLIVAGIVLAFTLLGGEVKTVINAITSAI